MKTLVDFDHAIYAIASACDNTKWNYRGRQWDLKAVAVKALEAEGKDSSELYKTREPEPWESVERTLVKYVDDFILSIENPWDIHFLVSGGGGNFRYDLATIKPYKGNRLQELPFHFQAVKDFICDSYEVKRVYGVEVDDAVGILYSNEYDLIVSPDKDLDQFPGLHLNPQKKIKYEVSKTQALQSFYVSVLVGDTSDNIPGVYGVGPTSDYVKTLRKMEHEGEMLELVSKVYESRFGSYWKMFLLENMQLLWLLHNHNSLHDVPVWMLKLMDDCSFYTETNWRDKIFDQS